MGRLLPRLALATLALLSSACASHRYTQPTHGERQRGVASWYGEPFHGRATASGEIYDMHQLTAAHRALPLGTVVDVTNLDNGRHVQVRVNDRGPFKKGRVLDLSYAAAKELDMIGEGLARVELQVVKIGQGRSGPTPHSRYVVQVGAFRELQNALDVKAKLADLAGVEITDDGNLHRVRIGPFASHNEAVEMKRLLHKRGFEAIVKPFG